MSNYQRIHIDKPVKEGTKKTTISIETLAYEFLCIKLQVEPHSKASHKVIREWVREKIETDYSYDPEAPYLFSTWLKKIILWEIVSDEVAEEWKNRLEP